MWWYDIDVNDVNLSSRAFDLAVAASLLILTGPFQLIIAVLVRLDSPGPSLHRAVRTGRGGRPFVVFKFRTMRLDGDVGPSITAAGDKRVTRIGGVLRRTKLDELPQLLNVLRGEMAMVGPRPEDPRYTAGYGPTELPIIAIKPGITSPASLTFRHEESLLATHTDDLESFYRSTVLPEKIAIDLDYLGGRSVRSDVGVLLRTVSRVALRSKHPVSNPE